MAIRTVLQLGDPACVKTQTAWIDPTAPEIRALIQDLADTLALWKSTTGYGRAIAAPQIGSALRVIFLQLPGGEPWPFVNPEITGPQRRKNRGLGRVLELSFDLYASRAAPTDYGALSGSAWRLA